MTNIKMLRIGVVLTEAMLSTAFGIFAIYYVGNDLMLDSISITLAFVYFAALVGILGPGYFYLRKIKHNERFVIASAFAVAWIFLAIFTYIILAFFVNLNSFQSKESGLIFPIIFGIVGFNIIAFKTPAHNHR